MLHLASARSAAASRRPRAYAARMRLNVHRFGPEDAPPLLAIHGVTSHGMRFRSLADEQLPDRRVLAVDLRGHGRSGWLPPWNVPTHLDDLRETMDAEGLEGPVDVMGHSFGGLLTLAMLAASPERIRRAVLLDPAIALPAAYCDERARQAVGFRGWASLDEAVAEREAMTAPHGHHFIPEEIAEHVELHDDGLYRARFSPAAAAVAWSEMALSAPIPAEARPVLIVQGLHDDYVQADTLVAPLRDALGRHLDVVGIESGHMVYWEAPGAVGDAVGRFLAA